jgi:flavin reductase (DIM6/NTAB) family NADH-FMN oxidoreductase RutF
VSGKHEERDLVSLSINTRTFRNVAGQFATGVSVIATEVDGTIHAMTANSLTSVSLNPMLMLFCLDRRAKMAEFMQQAQGFSINILREEQEALSSYFAGSWTQKNPPQFRFLDWEGGPLLDGCLAAMGCRLQKLVEAGDHWIITGEVVALNLGEEPHSPLLFHNSMYRKVDLSKSKKAPKLNIGKNDVKIIQNPNCET